MSHTVTVKFQVNDHAALDMAVGRLENVNFVAPGQHSRGGMQVVHSLDEARGKHRIYSGEYEGVGIQLPGWNYPAIVNLETGEIKYDNYGGSWGKQEELDGLCQAYAIEKTRNEALAHGMSMTEEVLENGEVRLTINDYRE